MEPAEVAEAMLGILSSSRRWSKGSLKTGPRLCLYGARAQIGLMPLSMGSGTIIWLLDQDPYMKALCAVIREQFPDRIKFRPRNVQLIVEFNDSEFTTYADVRMVLEKARAKLAGG